MIKISIITPAYNSAAYISKCIESVANVIYDHNFIEHIIVDDGSKDNTAQICKTYEKKYKHIKFFSKNNGNWGSVINYVKNNKLITGDYVIILDSDDQILPKAFFYINKHNQNSDIVLGNWWNYNGHKKTKWFTPLSFIFKQNFLKTTENDYFNHCYIPCCVYFKASLFYKTKDLLENLIYQDSILFAQLQALSTKIKHVNHSLGLYWSVRTGNTVTTGQSPLAIKSSLSNLYFYEKNNFLDLFATHLIFDPSNITEYLKMNDIKFHFDNPVLKLNGYTWWQRIHIKKIFNQKIKQLLK